LFEKIIVWAPSRKEAVQRMKRTLQEVRIEGIQTNIPFHLMVLDNKTFKKGDIATTFIAEEGIVEALRKKGEAFRQDLSTKAAAVSVALALSQEGIAHFCNGNGAPDRGPPSKWKNAGREENVNRRIRT
jgi:acetyl/propionyl-CoA carboxylase alpha subunit